VAALFVLLQATALGQSTADLIHRLQQEASSARVGQLDENVLRLLRELETELASDRYPSSRAFLALADELPRAGNRFEPLIPDLQLLAQRLSKIVETPLSEFYQSPSSIAWAPNLDDERKLLRPALDRCRARLDRIPLIYRGAWDEYLYWSEVRDLAQRDVFDQPALDRLEARWTNVHLAWNDPEISRTALAVRRFIHCARRAGDTPFTENHAGHLDEPIDDELVSSEAGRKKLSLLVAQLEARGIAADLTTAIRARISYPNAVIQISNGLLAQRFAQPLDEAFRIDEVIAGTRAVGNGRLSGTLNCHPSLSSTAAGWLWSMQATSTSQTVGVTQGVRVDSTSTSSLRGSKRFCFDATGLSVLPTAADATTAIQFTGIWAGGGGRRQGTALSEVYATRPRAEAESAASTRRFAAQRLDAEASTVLADFQRYYDRTIRWPLGQSAQLATSIRTEGGDSNQTWSCWLEELHGLAAAEPAPGLPLGADLATNWDASFIERYATARLSGRKFTAASLADELRG